VVWLTRQYGGDFHVRSMRCYEQFLVMAFAQLTYRESLRDIQTCLRALGPKLYHSRSVPVVVPLGEVPAHRTTRVSGLGL